MATEKQISQNVRKLSFLLTMEKKPENPIDITLYAFSKSNELLDSAPVKDGKATLSIRKNQARDVRLLVAPAAPDRKGTPTLSELLHTHPYEPVWFYDPLRLEFDLGAIPGGCIDCWWWLKCRVLGKVVKSVELEDGFHDMPVQNARVAIYEVDRRELIIHTVPDWMIDWLKEHLTDYVRIDPDLIHPPLPDPPELALDPSVLEWTPRAIASVNAKPRIRPRTALTESERERLAKVLIPSFLDAGRLEAKKILCQNSALFLPILMYWGEITSIIYLRQKIATAYTDHLGRFDRMIFWQRFGDHPDLYFTVDYMIEGEWTTVYEPPVSTSTYWDYPCGSEVRLCIDDLRVPWTGALPEVLGKQVNIYSIGQKYKIADIYGEGERPSGDPDSAEEYRGLTKDGKPFGGSLEPMILFGDGILAAGITHYRWSYRKYWSGENWKILETPVVRDYVEFLADNTSVNKVLQIGPDPDITNMVVFRVQPHDPPCDPGAASSTWNPLMNARRNCASAYLRSHMIAGGDSALQAGKYELKLELFKKTPNSNAVTRVNLNDEGIFLNICESGDPLGMEPVPMRRIPQDIRFPGKDREDLVIRDNDGKIIAFRIVLHIDNSNCRGMIYDTCGDDPEDVAGPCGFLEFQDPETARVNIGFWADHPNGYATYTFTLSKGSTGPIAEHTNSNDPIGTSSANFHQDPPTTYNLWKEIAVSALLNANGHACGRAVFAETLRVMATTTDGWDRLDYLDYSPPTRSFALIPSSDQIGTET